MGEAFHVHASVGATYAHHLRFVNKRTGAERPFTDGLSPDASVSLDYRRRAVSFYLMETWGSTFNYLDNVARKRELMYGVRVALFYSAWRGFLNAFRFEWVGLYEAVRAEAHVPVFIPYLYWQFQVGKRGR